MNAIRNRLGRSSWGGFSSRSPTPKDETGEIASAPREEDILRIIECPSCFEVPKPPIPQCTTGHFICSTCRSKLTKCPKCESDFSASRSFAVEEIIMSSKFSCNYKNFGCQELIVLQSLEEHGRQCPFRNGPITNEAEPGETAGGSLQRNATNASASLPDANPPATRACCQWIPFSFNDQIPQDAVEGGSDRGKRFYIARANHGRSIYLAKLYVFGQSHVCKVQVGGQAHIKDEYEVLVAVPGSVEWKQWSDYSLPTNAIVGHKRRGWFGFDSDLYIMRTDYWEHNGNNIRWVHPVDSFPLVRALLSNCEVLVKTDFGLDIEFEI